MNGQSVLFLAACRTVKPGRLLALAIVILLALHAGWVGAQAYPAKPIRVIVPNAPGGTSDILARLIGSKLTDAWGQRVIVDNRPGANGLIGAEMVARAAPDGYTLLLMDVGNLAISPSLYPKIPFDMLRDFAPITTLSYSPHALSTHPSVTGAGRPREHDRCSNHSSWRGVTGAPSMPGLAMISSVSRMTFDIAATSRSEIEPARPPSALNRPFRAVISTPT